MSNSSQTLAWEEAEKAYQSGDYATALRAFAHLAEVGDARAESLLGSMYLNGEGVSIDYGQALSWSRKAAERGMPGAQARLGYMYLHGRGVEKDPVKAGEWFQKAAQQGDASAMTNLGWLYETGAGVKQDYGEAARWYLMSAKSGDSHAQCNLGLCYLHGRGVEVEKDLAKAVEWFQKATQQGSANAITNLGWMYETGTGVPRDFPQALQLYESAAKLGEPYALNNLGLLYLDGRGVSPSYAKAVELFQQAIQHGYPEAQKNLEIAEKRQSTYRTMTETKAVSKLIHTQNDPFVRQLVSAVGLVSGDNPSAALDTLNSLLANPSLPLNVKADALGLMGLVIKVTNDYSRAKTLLQEALSIGQSSGWALESLELETVYADALAFVLGQFAYGELHQGRVSEAQAFLPDIEQIISKFSGKNKFNTIQHQGILLWLQGIVLLQSKESKAASEKFEQLVQPHFCEYFKSTGNGDMIGSAYKYLGPIYGLSSGSEDKAIEALRSSLLYFENDSKDAAEVRAMIADLETELKNKLSKYIGDLMDLTLNRPDEAIPSIDAFSRAAKDSGIETNESVPLLYFLAYGKLASQKADQAGANPQEVIALCEKSLSQYRLALELAQHQTTETYQEEVVIKPAGLFRKAQTELRTKTHTVTKSRLDPKLGAQPLDHVCKLLENYSPGGVHRILGEVKLKYLHANWYGTMKYESLTNQDLLSIAEIAVTATGPILSVFTTQLSGGDQEPKILFTFFDKPELGAGSNAHAVGSCIIEKKKGIWGKDLAWGESKQREAHA